jgi:hypothetical protein
MSSFPNSPDPTLSGGDDSTISLDEIAAFFDSDRTTVREWLADSHFTYPVVVARGGESAIRYPRGRIQDLLQHSYRPPRPVAPLPPPPTPPADPPFRSLRSRTGRLPMLPAEPSDDFSDPDEAASSLMDLDDVNAEEDTINSDEGLLGRYLRLTNKRRSSATRYEVTDESVTESDTDRIKEAWEEFLRLLREKYPWAISSPAEEPSPQAKQRRRRRKS